MTITRLQTFVLVHNDKIISPVLTTIREYGTWLQTMYDEYTCQFELYLKATKDNIPCMEYHPGTRIGNWFDKRQFTRSELYSWYILQNSTMMDKIRKFKMAEYRDAIPISVNDEQGRRMLRVYTLPQIELYIRSNIDKEFKIDNLSLEPKQIKIRATDFNKLIMPARQQPKKSLF